MGRMFFGRKRKARKGEITVTDPAARQRIKYIGLTEDDLGELSLWKDACIGGTDRLVDEFYSHVKEFAETRAILDKHTTVERQRPLIRQYISTMFCGKIDDQYVEYRRKVGEAHDRIDLDASWYVAMYEVIRRVLTETVRKAGASHRDLEAFGNALSRLILVDIGLTVTALMDARQEKIKSLNRRIEEEMRNEGRTFLTEMGEVLQSLSKGKLTARMRGEYKGEYVQIQQALNTTAQSLDEALSRVTTASEQVSTASGQISSGSHSLAQGTSEQASTLEEISSSLQEMASMTKQNQKNARKAKQLTEDARNSTSRGTERMNRLSDAMSKIKSSSDSTARIVKTIDEIAFQTNLLALNAAVEAARAGDAGKGFAVVAEEVRNLAMRSAEAAKSTATLIEESVKNSEQGVSINSEVLASLQEINEQVNNVSVVMSEIATASDQQSAGVEQITTAVEQINLVTQQTAAHAEESASAAEELSGQAAEMQSMIANFELSQPGRSLRQPLLRDAARPAVRSTSAESPAPRRGKPSSLKRPVVPAAKQKTQASPDEFHDLTAGMMNRQDEAVLHEF